MLQEFIGPGGADLYNSAVCMRPYISYSFFACQRARFQKLSEPGLLSYKSNQHFLEGKCRVLCQDMVTHTERENNAFCTGKWFLHTVPTVPYSLYSCQQ